MTLEEVRAGIDAVDTQMKPLFLKRMECGKHVAEVKAQTGGDVFVLERELEIIEKRATDVDPEIQEEYKTFLRHLMSLCRKYEYELLPEMQEKVMTAALAAAGLTAETEHTQVKIGFTCPKETSDLNLFVNMTKLNGTAARCPALSSPSARPLTIMAPFFASSPPISAAAFRPYSVGLRLPTMPTAPGSLSQRGSPVQ